MVDKYGILEILNTIYEILNIKSEISAITMSNSSIIVNNYPKMLECSRCTWGGGVNEKLHNATCACMEIDTMANCFMERDLILQIVYRIIPTLV
jgi:hypothetical protein